MRIRDATGLVSLPITWVLSQVIMTLQTSLHITILSFFPLTLTLFILFAGLLMMIWRSAMVLVKN